MCSTCMGAVNGRVCWRECVGLNRERCSKGMYFGHVYIHVPVASGMIQLQKFSLCLGLQL